MPKLSELKVVIGLSKEGLRQLNTDLRNTQGKFKKNFGQISGMVQQAGRNMTIGLTAPLGIMAAQSVKAFDEQQKAIAQVEAGLASTGAQVGYTSEQLQKMAADLQAKTLFGDEEILKGATAQLLTFTNIAGENFDRTQAVALDLATRLDGDLKSASIQLGKALNDPVANLTALSRAGIQFSADQKEVIKGLAEGGNLAQAQTIILAELEKQYGGSAAAAAQAGTGPFKQLQNTISDISEEFGRLINDMLKPLVPKIQALVASFTNLTDRQKKVALTLAAIAASVGPLMLLVSGLIKARMAMAALNLVMMANPLGAVVAGVTLLVGAITLLRSSTKTTREETESFILRTKELDKEQEILALNTKRRAMETELAQLKQAEAAEKANAAVGSLGDKFDKQIASRNVSRYGEQITDMSSAIIELKKATAEAQFGDTSQAGLSVLPTPTPAEVQSTQELSTTLTQEMLPAMEKVAALHRPMADDILAAAYANHELKGSFTELGEAVKLPADRMIELSKFAAQQLPGFFSGAFDAIADSTQSFGQYIMDVLERLIKKAITLAATFAAISIFTGGAGGAAVGGFGGFMKEGFGLGGIPQMASGGLFTGASLAMVGEGSGTSLSNPEVVAPLDKLQQMMGGGNVTVTGMIRGSDILLSNERSALDRNRVRGF